MRCFTYRHWDAELALVGEWTEAAASQLRAMHDELWSDSPPGLRGDADHAVLTALGELDDPLARVLFVMYHAVGQGFARRTGEVQSPQHKTLLRHAARRILSELPIAHVEQPLAAGLLGQKTLHINDGAYVRGTALSALRELAQAEDVGLLLARLAPAEAREPAVAAADLPTTAEGVDERVEAVAALESLVKREPALPSRAEIAARLLALVTDDQSVPVRIAALQALMAMAPDERVRAVLRSIAENETDTAAELSWAATIALYTESPAASAALVVAVFRRATRPEGFSALFTQLELLAEEAVLRLALAGSAGCAPLIWRNLDCAVFALCLPDGSLPPGAAEPELGEIAAQWMHADPPLRAALLARLASSGHAAGRALAILTGPDTGEFYNEVDEDEDGTTTESRAESVPTPEVDWRLLARLVLADPPLTRISAAEGRALVEQSAGTAVGNSLPPDLGQYAANHSAAVALLGQLGETSDNDTLSGYLLQDFTRRSEPLLVTTIDALYSHCRRWGQPLVADSLLPLVTALAHEGSAKVRQHAVLLLGCFPATATAALLRELSRDPTATVCCIADRALGEQALA